MMAPSLAYHRSIVIAAVVCSFLLVLYGFTTLDFTGGVSQLENYLPNAGSRGDGGRGVANSKYKTRGDEIPNVIHFIIGSHTPNSPIKLNLLAFISMYSASYHMPDAEIWLHTDTSDEMIKRAKNLAGLQPPSFSDDISAASHEVHDPEYLEYWTQAVVQGVKNLKFVRIEKQYSPTPLGNVLEKLANWADFVRADILYEYGGTVMDLDVVTLRDITPLRRSGFRNIIARDWEIQCGVIMSAAGGNVGKNYMTKAYRDLMDGAFDPDLYAFHATSLLHSLKQTLARVPYEVLLLSDKSLYPISWDPNSWYGPGMLYSIRTEDLSAMPQDHGDLLDFDYDAWIKTVPPLRYADWRLDGPFGLDLSETYLLHVYHSTLRAGIASGVIKDLTESVPSKLAHGLTLKLVLEGNSHFSRAVMSPVRDALEKGFISL